MGRKKDKFMKRIVNFYKSVFKNDPPLKIIIDGNFIGITMKKKHDLKEILAKSLDETVHIIITQCILNEINEVEKKIPGILNYTLKYKIESCSHNLSPEDCIKSYIGKKNYKRYYVATQDNNLRKYLRSIPGVPILYNDQNIIMIEKPSFASKEAFLKRESLKMEPKKDEKLLLSRERKDVNNFMKEEYMKSLHYQKRLEDIKLMRINGRLKRKAKGPNPLSVLKKKSIRENNQEIIRKKLKLKLKNKD
jgi:U3 small nucleolar RNA-associated protein 23